MFTVDFTRAATRHLNDLRAYERAIVVAQIEVQLVHEPVIETRHRKKLRPNHLAGWELRAGDLRVLYDVDEEAEQVLVMAIGVKEGDRLIVGGEELEL